MIFNRQQSMIENFEACAQQNGLKVALHSASGQLTYAELADKVAQLARMLSSHGIGSNELIGIHVRKPLDMIVAMLAVAKVNGCYINLDARYPEQWVSRQIHNSGVQRIITSESTITALGDLKTRAPISEPAFSVHYDQANPEEDKLAIITHSRIMEWWQFNSQVLKSDLSRTLLLTAAGFELEFPIWIPALLSGGSIYLYDNEALPVEEVQWIASETNTTCLIAPLSFMQSYSEVCKGGSMFGDSLKTIFTQGDAVFHADACKASLKERQIKWYNYFQFPELNVITGLVEAVSGKGDEYLHTGRPAMHAEASILNKNQAPCPFGVTGDLYLSHDSMVMQYFKADGQQIRKSSYKTAYRASMRTTGQIDLHGRTDRTINAGGYYIFLPQIENLLLSYRTVQDCGIVLETNSGRRPLRLKAYLVLNGDGEIQAIKELLEQYDCPSVLRFGFVVMPFLPRTKDGSIDYEQLRQLASADSVALGELGDRLSGLAEVDEVLVIQNEAFTSHSWLAPDELRSERINKRADQEAAMLSWSDKHSFVNGGALDRSGEPLTLADAFMRTVTNKGHHLNLFIHANGEQQYASYAELLAEAEQVLGGLRSKRLRPKDKVMLMIENRYDFIVSFWGCVLGGMIPVPVAAPKELDENSLEVRTLANIWLKAGKPFLLSSSQLAENRLNVLLSKLAGSSDMLIQSSCVEELRAGQRDGNWASSEENDTAVLLFTSGSTGIPKGVPLTHRNIVHKCQGVAQALGMHAEDRSLNWMPLEHVGGLVLAHIRDVYIGISAIDVPTAYILRDPLVWLDLCSEHKVSATWAPNFAYGLINQSLETGHDDKAWDLSALRYMINGGESIAAKTMNKCISLLEKYRLPANALRPVYGLSETSSGIIYSAGYCKYDSADEGIAEIGRPIPGVSVRIVDEEGKLVVQGQEGRLQVKGEPVFQGYLDNKTASADVFTEDGWMITGDLAVMNDGRITISGREKDIIICNGINYNNHEIESMLGEIAGLDPLHTVAVGYKPDNKDTESVVVFFVSKHADVSIHLQQIKQIQTQLNQLIGSRAEAVIPLKKESIPKTAIGKIQRSKLLELYKQGHYQQLVDQISREFRSYGEQKYTTDWFYEKTWKEKRLPEIAVKKSPVTGLVFSDPIGLGERFAGRIEQEGHTCIRVQHGKQFRKIDKLHYMITLQHEDDYKRLVDSIAKDELIVEDVIHCYSYTDKSAVEEVSELKRSQSLGVLSLHHLIQAFQHKAMPSKWLVVSNYSQAVMNEDSFIAPEKSPLISYLKSASQEQPHQSFVHIDFDDIELAVHADHLYSEWAHPCKDTEVAYRKANRLVPLLAPVELSGEPGRSVPIQQEALYIITGGLGGIGIELCKWLLQTYSAKLVIIGRTPLHELHLAARNHEPAAARKVAVLQEWEDDRQPVIYDAGDISDERFLQDVVRRAERKWNQPLAGIFHLAGMESKLNETARNLVSVQSQEDLDAMFHSKLYGTFQLSRLLKDNKNSLFVAFSSAIIHTGAIGFSAYGAANRFLDGFCRARKLDGYEHTYCLNWSTWDNVGMSAGYNSQMVQLLSNQGYRQISIADGLHSLELALLGRFSPLYIGFDANNSKVARMQQAAGGKQQVSILYTSNGAEEDAIVRETLHWAGLNNLQDKLEFHVIKADSLASSAIAVHLFNQAAAVDKASSIEAEEYDEYEAVLHAMWKDVLRTDRVTKHDSFFDLGGNSIALIQLHSRMDKWLPNATTIVDLFNYPTIAQLSGFLRAQQQGENTDAQDNAVNLGDMFEQLESGEIDIDAALMVLDGVDDFE